MGVKSFTIYEEYYDLITLLSKEEQKDLIYAIFQYMFEDIEPVLNDKQNKVFINLKRPLNISKINSKRSIGHKYKKETERETNIETEEIPIEIPIEIPKRNRETKTSNDVNVNVYVNVYVKEIIEYLNYKTNKNFKYNSKNTIKHIKARLEEGYTIEDFKKVIDIKTLEWLNDKKMNQYLRPDTLFGTKFESYLNQQPKELTTKDLAEKIDFMNFVK